MLQIRNSVMKILLFLGLLFLGGLFDIFGNVTGQHVISTSYYLLLGMAFVSRMSDRIVDQGMRRRLSFCACMMVFFFLLRGLKYHVFREVDVIARMLWYFYYVPTLMIPMASFQAAMHLDADLKEKKRDWGGRILLGITITMLLLILTNDWHQWIFRFQPGFQNWDSDYQYGVCYFLIAAYILILFLGAVYLLVKKCRISMSKKLFWVPLLPILGGLLYVVAYFLGAAPKWRNGNFIEFPEVSCFVVACFWECCISIGLIPSNKGYEKLFMESGIAAQIMDRSFERVYASETAAALTRTQMEGDGEQALSEETILHRADVRGGYVFWQSDVSEICRLNRELTELEERLSEETELIRLQNEMLTKRTEIEETNRVYDTIAAKVHPQSQRIAELAREAEECSELYEKNMFRICCLATYIKRYANLTLLSEGNQLLCARELGLAIAESLRTLSDMGIPATLSGISEAMVPAKLMVSIYAWLDQLWETAGEYLAGVHVRLTDQECRVSLELAGSEKGLEKAPQWRELIGKPVLWESYFWEDGTLYARFPYQDNGHAMEGQDDLVGRGVLEGQGTSPEREGGEALC